MTGRSIVILRIVICLLAEALLPASPSGSWTALRSTHFELSYQSGSEVEARATLDRLEQIRSFFVLQTGLDLDRDKPVRVIVFRSRKEYEAYQLSSTADAYFAAMGSDQYIVASGLGEARFRTLAHEYAHLVLYAARLKLPAWLNEGLAEVVSTLQFTRSGIMIGGPIRAHVQTLRADPWMSVDQLFSTQDRLRDDRARAIRFYAHAWALTEMLMFSPEYAARFRIFVDAVAAGTAESKALSELYGNDLVWLDRNLRARTNQGAYSVIHFPISVPLQPTAAAKKNLSAIEARALLAGLLEASGSYDRAASEYRELAQLQPGNSSFAAALGAIALHQHDPETARREWKRAMDIGISDPVLCYQYAVLADQTTIPVAEVRSALRRAVFLDPAFDDARWRLALIENNTGSFQESAAELRAMTAVPPARAFAYWSTLSYVEDQLDHHEAAAKAADAAERFAATDADRSHARELAYIARTEVRMRVSIDAIGRREMVTTRVPRGTADWNPFVQPGDAMKSTEGKLSEVVCDDGRLSGIVIRGRDGVMRLAISEPDLVLVLNGPSQFMCGVQPNARSVLADYAASATNSALGTVRGIRFE